VLLALMMAVSPGPGTTPPDQSAAVENSPLTPFAQSIVLMIRARRYTTGAVSWGASEIKVLLRWCAAAWPQAIAGPNRGLRFEGGKASMIEEA
jgi:hypothetical protein